MKWAHLPLAGGLYDQSPEFVDGIKIIFAALARKENQDARKREADAAAAKRKSRK